MVFYSKAKEATTLTQPHSEVTRDDAGFETALQELYVHCFLMSKGKIHPGNACSTEKRRQDYKAELAGR